MYIINIDSVDLQTPGVGMKAASLGELSKAGFLVPKGFVVTSQAFEKFLSDTGIGLLLPHIVGGVDPENPGSAFEASGKIRELFYRTSGNDFMIRELKGAYNELSFGKDVSSAGGAALDLIRAGRGDCFVSVRPSVVCGKPASFAGHGKAALNLIGFRQVLNAVKECWLSFFRPEALVYRKIQGIEQFSMAVMVQKMVDSELSGTLFTQEPVSGEGRILVEGFWGLGETMSCGCLSPDQYLIHKDGSLLSKRVGKKIWLRRRGPLSGQTIQERVPASRVNMETLADRNFPNFAAIAKKVEALLGPQHLEWGVDRGRIVILQAGPVVFSRVHVSSTAELTAQSDSSNVAEPLSFQGIGVSAGTGKGKAMVIKDFSWLRRPEEPVILATKSLSMEILPYMGWFSGIVSEQGGAGSCLASLGRELGIPIVCGIENAGILLDGKEIVVDGLKGNVRML